MAMSTSPQKLESAASEFSYQKLDIMLFDSYTVRLKSKVVKKVYNCRSPDTSKKKFAGRLQESGGDTGSGTRLG